MQGSGTEPSAAAFLGALVGGRIGGGAAEQVVALLTMPQHWPPTYFQRIRFQQIIVLEKDFSGRENNRSKSLGAGMRLRSMMRFGRLRASGGGLECLAEHCRILLKGV